MKFIHIADVHIGAKPDAQYPWGEEREKEIIRSFNSIIDICNEQAIDLLLIAGDLFHKQPLLRELKEVNYIFEKLEKTHVVVIAGNHDYISTRSNYRDFIWCDQVTMLMDDSLDSVYFEDINTEVYGFSYHTREITEPLYDVIYPGCEERINILLAHGGSIKNIPIDKRKVQSNGFDYVALGHIHKPEQFGNRMAYSGSLEPMDKNELDTRGYIVGTIQKEQSNHSNIEIEFVSHSHRQYKYIELTADPTSTHGSLMDAAKESIQTLGVQNIYRIVLKGIRDKEIKIIKKEFHQLGNVVEVLDETVPDYDFDTLYQDNMDNIIGLYIKNIQESQKSEEVIQKALYYGMEALLGAKNK